MLFWDEFCYPYQPHQEYNEVEKGFENVIVEKVNLGGPGNEGEGKANDADNVDEFDDDQAQGNVPDFVFPGAWKQEHKEEPVHPLLQAGATWADQQVCPGTVG